ncbi:FAR1-related sequence 5-like protein, partial [Tanacetum coccineum]
TGIEIGKVFPQTRHRYYAWHIQKHVLEHLQPLRSQYDDFQDTYAKWVKSQNIEDYETKWEELKEKYQIDDDCCSKTMLNDFVVQYDKVVDSRRSAKGVRDSPCEIEKLNTFFDDCLDKQHQRHNIGVEVNSVINSTILVVTQSEQDIIAFDPINRVKTKGCPKAATRITSGLEISMEAKKIKKCSYCRAKGHNITRCPKKKMDEAKANNRVEVLLEYIDMEVLNVKISEC